MRRPTLPLLAVCLSTACGPQQNLEELNQELSEVTLQEALATRTTYEPLCDAEGYPLVGNVNSKGGTTASEFCHAAQGERR